VAGALVTGAGSGIGEGVAVHLASTGRHVVLAGRRRRELDRVAARIDAAGGRSSVVPADVSVEADVQRLFATAGESAGRIDAVVHCAAVFERGLVRDLSVQTWERIMGVNVRGTFLVGRESLRVMSQAGGGSIVLIASIGGVSGTDKFAGNSAYTASKGAVIAFGESLAVEAREHRVEVVVVSPGAVDTEMLRAAAPALRPRFTPAELAPTLAFLASAAAAPLTGSNIVIHSNA